MHCHIPQRFVTLWSDGKDGGLSQSSFKMWKSIAPRYFERDLRALGTTAFHSPKLATKLQVFASFRYK